MFLKKSAFLYFSTSDQILLRKALLPSLSTSTAEVELTIRQGDITSEPVDCIISNSNSDLIHDDGLSLALVETAAQN